MTTTVYELRNKYGVTDQVMSMLSSLMVKGLIQYEVKDFDIEVKPIGGKPYIKTTRARVFELEDAIEAAKTKEYRYHTVSVHQRRVDAKLREKALGELTQALIKNKEQS